MAGAAAGEIPPGKWSGDENFPVGSRLLAARVRPHVAAFYAFARTADDIADHPALVPGDKLRRLTAFEDALVGRRTDDPGLARAHRLRESLAETGLGPRHALDLIAAFKQDAAGRDYRRWDELIGYCMFSAAPVGRYLLDLHGEDRACWPASDALCNALQVLNHLQDCRQDYVALNRVYLPRDWMDEARATTAGLAAAAASPALRTVIDRALDGAEALMVEARALPGRLVDQRLAMESAVIVRLADRLAALLRAGDPIAGRIRLRRWDFARCTIAALLAACRPATAPARAASP